MKQPTSVLCEIDHHGDCAKRYVADVGALGDVLVGDGHCKNMST